MFRLLTAVALFSALSMPAMAAYNDDIFGGLFDSAPEQTQKVKHGHVKQTVSQYDNDGGSSDWSSYWGHSDHRGSHMVASFYGHGERLAKHTASGAVFNPHGYTAAHRTLPFGTHLRVCHHGCVTVVVNDRGPFVSGRSLDLAYGAARAIGMGSTSNISVERLN